MTTGRSSGYDILRDALTAVEGGESVVVATVVATSRSVPRHAGTRMLVFGDGTQQGTIGGGEMEGRVITAAAEVLRSGVPRFMTFDLVDPGVGDPGVCGGTVNLYLGPFMPEPNVVIIGCGHVGRAVAERADHQTTFGVGRAFEQPLELNWASGPGALRRVDFLQAQNICPKTLELGSQDGDPLS